MIAVYKKMPFYTLLTNVTQAYNVSGIYFLSYRLIFSMSGISDNTTHTTPLNSRNDC